MYWLDLFFPSQDWTAPVSLGASALFMLVFVGVVALQSFCIWMLCNQSDKQNAQINMLLQTMAEQEGRSAGLWLQSPPTFTFV